jgi:hypothetical protein
VAKKKLCVDDLDDLVNLIGADKPINEQVVILKNTIKDILEHGWIDEALKDQIMSNIAENNKIPYKSGF